MSGMKVGLVGAAMLASVCGNNEEAVKVVPVPPELIEAATTVPEPPSITTTTEPAPVPTTTTTVYDWGPVICPDAPHPAHHEPCMGTRARTAAHSHEAPSPQSRTVRPASGRTPPEYIKQCESGGSYTAVNPNGHYGAWQFSQSTWESVGGTGRPDHASPAEQDKRAAILWDGGRGASHWECA